jgi:tetratricopeptide (TPR) repeat protein
MMRNFFFILIIICVSRSIAQNDQLVNYKLGLAQNYELAGQLDKAELLYKELFLLQPTNYQFFDLLNKVYISQKKYNESLQLIETRIKQTPGDPSLYGILGTTYFIMDDSKKAYETWDRGIALNPKSSINYRVIANVAIENRAYDKAIQLLNDGKKISEEAYVFSMELANVYAYNMNFGRAATELCELILVHPEQTGFVRNRISSFITRPLAAEQTINAIKDFSDEHGTSVILDLLAFTYQQTGKFQEGFKIVKQIETDSKGNGTNMYIFAQTLFDQKQFEVSAKAFNYILENFSNSPYAVIARINYAKAREESLNQKSDSVTSSWKPLSSKQKVNDREYKEIITAYTSFAGSEQTNAYTAEALLRIGEIYRIRLFDLKKADSIYSALINTFPLSTQAIQAKLSSGKIAIETNSFEKAREQFTEIISNSQSVTEIISEARHYLARIEFWNGNFFVATQRLKEMNLTLSNDYSNDAIELNFLISIAKKDSINLIKYAIADLLLLQNKLEQAATEFKTLADNDNLFVINQFAKSKLAEIFICKDDFFSAEKLLEELSREDNSLIFVDKSTFLLGMTYLYGSKDIPKAKETFQKILEKFPNSIYFDRARVELNSIQTKNG